MNAEITSIINKIYANQKNSKIILTKAEENIIRNCSSTYLIENKKAEKFVLLKLKAIEERTRSYSIENNNSNEIMTKELGLLTEYDLQNKKTIANTSVQNSTHVLFNPEWITGYDKISTENENSFQQAINFPLFCAAAGQSGIKKLGGNNSLPKCHVIKGNLNKEFVLGYELKINGKGRILFFELTTKNNGKFLVAGVYLKDGLHKKSDAQKTYHVHWKMPYIEDIDVSHEKELCYLKNASKSYNRYSFYAPVVTERSAITPVVEMSVAEEISIVETSVSTQPSLAC